MALGLVLIAMFGATSVSMVLFAYQFPVWAVLLAYPLTGAFILLPGVALVGWIRQNPPDAPSGQLVTSQSPAAPHPQSRAGSSNP
jgi:O-antigen ligase